MILNWLKDSNRDDLFVGDSSFIVLHLFWKQNLYIHTCTKQSWEWTLRADVILEGLLEVVLDDGLQAGASGAVECVREATYNGKRTMSFCKIGEVQGNSRGYEQKRDDTWKSCHCFAPCSLSLVTWPWVGPIFVRFQMIYTVKLTNSLFSAVHFAPLDGWTKSIQNTWILVYRYLK